MYSFYDAKAIESCCTFYVRHLLIMTYDEYDVGTNCGYHDVFRYLDMPKGTGTAPSYTCRLAALQVATGLRRWYQDLTYVTWFSGKCTKDFDTGWSTVS